MDLSSGSSRPASRQVSCEIRKDFSDMKHSSSLRLKVKSRDSGIFDRTSAQSLIEPGLNRTCAYISVSESYVINHTLSSSSECSVDLLNKEARIHLQRGDNSITFKNAWKFHFIHHILEITRSLGFSPSI